MSRPGISVLVVSTQGRVPHATSAGRTQMKCKYDRGNPAEQGIEADPEQKQGGASREVLLRGPKSEEQLEEACYQAEPPDRIDTLAGNCRH